MGTPCSQGEKYPYKRLGIQVLWCLKILLNRIFPFSFTPMRRYNVNLIFNFGLLGDFFILFKKNTNSCSVLFLGRPCWTLYIKFDFIVSAYVIYYGWILSHYLRVRMNVRWNIFCLPMSLCFVANDKGNSSLKKEVQQIRRRLSQMEKRCFPIFRSMWLFVV